MKTAVPSFVGRGKAATSHIVHADDDVKVLDRFTAPPTPSTA